MSGISCRDNEAPAVVDFRTTIMFIIDGRDCYNVVQSLRLQGLEYLGCMYYKGAMINNVYPDIFIRLVIESTEWSSPDGVRHNA